MRTHNRRSQPVIGALATLAFAAVAAIGVAAPAAAAGPNIDPDIEGSITLHKFESPASNPELPNTGEQIDPAELGGLTPLNDVDFTFTPLNVDLLTNEGWDTVDGWADDVSTIEASDKDSANDFTVTTAGQGEASTGTVGLSAYLVEETAGPDSIVTPAAPFVITMPLPTTLGDGDPIWLTDIHVYPKNGVSGATKTVDDADAYALGDTVSWTLSGDIPGGYGVDEISSFSLSDTPDSRLQYIADSYVATLSAPGQPDVALTEGNQIELVVPAPGTVEFKLTDVGLSLANGDYSGGVLSVTIDTKVMEVGDGTIVNTVFVNVNGRSIESLPVDTKWGVLEIFKFEDGSDPALGLSGATFQVYTTETGGSPLAVTVGVDGDGNDIRVTDFTTGADGRVVIPGLKANVTYWLEESVAPTRYRQLTDRIEVTGLTAGDTLEVPRVVEVANSKIPDWQLPLTGASGMMVPLAGLALLAVAGGAALTLSRRGKRTQA